MQLTSMGQLAIDNFEDLSFLMRDGDNVVRIDVQRSLLKDLSRSRSRPLAATFDEHRNRIEQIACAKYDARDYLSCANSRIVTIKKDDWARSLPGDSRQQEAYGPPRPCHQGDEAD